MHFLNREREAERLEGLIARGGGFAAVFGRRRIGKTRLLVEWVRRHGGVYTVADQSAAHVQRRYFAEALSARLPGFADVDYRDWRSLFSRLSREALAQGWRGPLVLDELPYLVQVSPDLPAILQRWIDHEASALVVVVAGSSQHMMQGLVLDGAAPLYGRAYEILEIKPLNPRLIPVAFGGPAGIATVEAYAAWGGVPRYWELAVKAGDSVERQIDRLVLDPLGPLHREPDRLIAEELPPATEVRALLDAIGGGAHRLSEIGARIGRPATSLSRPLQRLQGMGLVRREVPFGDDERATKRSLYRICDPFTSLWFRVVAPHRALLATTNGEGRRDLLRRYWPQILGSAWEDLCRLHIPELDASTPLGALGPWGPATRWWHGNAPEWDVVARSLDGKRLLLGEVKVRVASIQAAIHELTTRPPPNLAGGLGGATVIRALFVADLAGSAPGTVKDVLVVSSAELLATVPSTNG